MLDSRDIGGLQGAPVHGPDNEKIGNVNQVFVDAVTGAPNWVTLKTGFLGRHEIFAPLANATWDAEVLHIQLDKETLLAAPRLNADEGLSPHNEEALNRHFGLSDVDTDGGTARPAEEYPERTELVEEAAARKREEESADADQTPDADRHPDDQHHEERGDEGSASPHDDDRSGSDEDNHTESAQPVFVERDVDGQAYSSDSDVDASRGLTDPSTDETGVESATDRNGSGPRHAKPNRAL